MKKTAATLLIIGTFFVFSMILLKAEICEALVEIDMPLEYQEHSNWCWAGSSQAVLDYYGALPSQCTIANWAFIRSDCCGNTTFDWNYPSCNQGNAMYSTSGSIQGILSHWGVNSTGLAYAINFPTVVSEINAHRPFVMRYQWTNLGGHFLVGRGYDQSTNQINYMDPWPGNGYTAALYSWAVSASDHTWTHTLQLTTTPRPDLVVTGVYGPSSGARGQTVSVSFSVRNQGNGPTNFSPSGGGSIEHGVYLSTNTTIDTSDRRICQWFDSEIEAGRTEPYTVNCIIPADLAPGTYYWGVIADVGLAIAESNDSNNSNYDSGPITIVCPVPGAPGLASPANGATNVSTTPNLDWGGVSGATSYDVQVCSNSSCSSVARSASNVTTSYWTVSSALSNWTLYYWRVRARNSCGLGSWSGIRSLTTSVITPLNDTAEFVKQQYRDFLNREGDSGGIQFWKTQIDSGAVTKAQVIESFFSSAEFAQKIAPIVRLYFAYFLRIPEYTGLMFWINSGWPLGAISDFFAGSSEFQQRYGSLSNEQFVNLVYQNVLGRIPDPGGYAFWVGQLNSMAMTRGQMMIGFSESAEYKAKMANEVYVTMMYIGMLRRSPDQGGFNFWVNYLDTGNSGLALINGFLVSPEYANRF